MTASKQMVAGMCPPQVVATRFLPSQTVASDAWSAVCSMAMKLTREEDTASAPALTVLVSSPALAAGSGGKRLWRWGELTERAVGKDYR